MSRDGRYKELVGPSWDKPSTLSAPSSWHNSFAVLGDYMADLMASWLGIDYAKATDQHAMIVQLDLEKAFNQLNWSFLDELMHAMGFGPCMSNIMYTIGSGSISHVMMNSGVMEPVTLSRSVRPSCPLSPLFFAIATHPILTLLTHLEMRQEVVGLSLRLGHQMVGQSLADDSCMFLKATIENIE
ncbi:hypothetical protein L7F22_067396 [Adiantum nelumboides]|nr:hypothetical protein [Adiantum nelumboides]